MVMTILINTTMMIFVPGPTCPLGPIEEFAHSHVGEVWHVGIDMKRLLVLSGKRLIGMCHHSVQTRWLPYGTVRQGQRRFIGRFHYRLETERRQESGIVSHALICMEG